MVSACAAAALVGCAASVTPLDGAGGVADAAPDSAPGVMCPSATELTEGVPVTLSACDGLPPLSESCGESGYGPGYGPGVLVRYTLRGGLMAVITAHTDTPVHFTTRDWGDTCDATSCADVVGAGRQTNLTTDVTDAWSDGNTADAVGWTAIAGIPGDPCVTYTLTLSFTHR